MRPDAISLLREDHARVEELLARLERALDEELLGELADALLLHSQIEEDVVYPALRRALPDQGRRLDRSVGEHRHLDDLLADLLAGSGEGSPDLVLDDLFEEVRRHVEEEERELFPRWEEACSRVELEEVGALVRRARAEGGTTPDADEEPEAADVSKAELYEEARRLGVRGRSRMSKDELGRAVEREQL